MIFIIAFFLVGFVASFLGSLAGLGGGFIIVPVLNLLFDYSIRDAIFFSLVAIFFLSSLHNLYNRELIKTHRKLLWQLGIFSILGSLTAAMIGSQSPSLLLERIFAFVTIGFALFYLVDYISIPKAHMAHFFPTPVSRLLAFLAGGLSGLLGIGGGVMNVPFLNKVLGFKMTDSTKLSFVFTFLATATALIFYFQTRRENLEDINILYFISMLCGTLMGFHTTQTFNLSQKNTQKVFCALILIIGILKLIQTY